LLKRIESTTTYSIFFSHLTDSLDYPCSVFFEFHRQTKTSTYEERIAMECGKLKNRKRRGKKARDHVAFLCNLSFLSILLPFFVEHDIKKTSYIRIFYQHVQVLQRKIKRNKGRKKELCFKH
jgi:hypothetical protein